MHTHLDPVAKEEAKRSRVQEAKTAPKRDAETDASLCCTAAGPPPYMHATALAGNTYPILSIACGHPVPWE